ncbi:RNA 2',3'-cyclic phosphodiesterase [Deferribacter autotrophicus]|uniref:RNA 2',3'-cyclic phosphodiesterase n=1 Tax=Deferribacter autotrophicus TaxID=500465 RepID=A0A5A8F4K9_9BACT|nr:RNA 2',3'-cyclic phosphodiesterase [Deferribacter autotrophicus]KAA0258897.1 RNA 2',3'-cyclic phosphodiesterase [Deferribacter autotrophicus]
MRLFIAVKCDDKLNSLVFKSGNFLKNFGAVKPVELENLHITLAFLGDQKEESLKSIIDCIDAVEPQEIISINFKKFNFFERNGMPVVFFLEGESDNLTVFTNNLRKKLKEKRISFDDKKKFIIHLTAARIKRLADKKGFKEYVARLNENFKPYKTYIKTVYLFKSTLTQHGPVYEQIYAKELKS